MTPLDQMKAAYLNLGIDADRTDHRHLIRMFAFGWVGAACVLLHPNLSRQVEAGIKAIYHDDWYPDESWMPKPT